MKVGNSMVVEIHYIMKNESGEVIDTTQDQDPIAYLHGANNIIEGLEDALDELEVGDDFDVSIPPEKSFGIQDMRLINTVDKSIFPEETKFEIGEQFMVESDQGPRPIVIKEVSDKTVVIDGNHELAGQTVHYSGTVVSIREANKNELYHGAVNSPCCVGDKCSSSED